MVDGRLNLLRRAETSLMEPTVTLAPSLPKQRQQHTLYQSKTNIIRDMDKLQKMCPNLTVGQNMQMSSLVTEIPIDLSLKLLGFVELNLVYTS